MGICRFIGGGQCNVGETVFEFVGQRAEFSDLSFREVLRGRGVFITEEQFETLDITDEQIAAMQRNPAFTPDEDLAAKLKRGRILACENMALAEDDLL